MVSWKHRSQRGFKTTIKGITTEAVHSVRRPNRHGEALYINLARGKGRLRRREFD